MRGLGPPYARDHRRWWLHWCFRDEGISVLGVCVLLCCLTPPCNVIFGALRSSLTKNNTLPYPDQEVGGRAGSREPGTEHGVAWRWVQESACCPFGYRLMCCMKHCLFFFFFFYGVRMIIIYNNPYHFMANDRLILIGWSALFSVKMQDAITHSNCPAGFTACITYALPLYFV